MMAHARGVSLGDLGRGSVLAEHAALLGRVCMALLGDAARVEDVLVLVAGQAKEREKPEGVDARVWLLGLVRAACATQLSKMPPRSLGDDAPLTSRMEPAKDARAARARLAELKPSERDAVVLFVVGGLRPEGVATACGIDVETARARISRGIEATKGARS
mgnify:CR=1 FL=1